jgi:hypothetical protein
LVSIRCPHSRSHPQDAAEYRFGWVIAPELVSAEAIYYVHHYVHHYVRCVLCSVCEACLHRIVCIATVLSAFVMPNQKPGESSAHLLVSADGSLSSCLAYPIGTCALAGCADHSRFVTTEKQVRLEALHLAVCAVCASILSLPCVQCARAFSPPHSRILHSRFCILVCTLRPALQLLCLQRLDP